jgi:ribosomal protein S19
MMRENRLLRKNKKISHFIVGEMVSIINGKKLIEFYITREKIGFTLGHFEYEDPLSEKIRSIKTKAKLNFLEKGKNG